MSGGRHTVPVDVHLLAVRDGEQGPEVLLSRRAGDVYAAGLWHAPSGHLERETVVAAVVRETLEETGLVVDPADVRAAVTVHHRPPGGQARVGFFFEVRRWHGTPQVREPDKCDAIGWFPLADLPEPMVAYCRAGLDAYRAGAPVALHFQDPGDPISYDPAVDRLLLVPGHGIRGAAPEEAVRAFTERAVGRVAGWTDVSWAREESRVWQARGAGGGTWYVKIHQNDRFHRREVTALREWVPGLGGGGPRLVAADPGLLAVVVTAVEGRPLHGAVLPGVEERAVFRSLGVLAARIHASALPPPPPTPTITRADRYGKVDRHLEAARPHLAPGDEEHVRAVVEQARRLEPLPLVVTHGDFQIRNILRAADGSLRIVDFERSEPQPVVRDLVRLLDRFDGREDLCRAFFDGYGRPFTALERAHLATEAVLDAVSGIGYGAAHGDPELVERGRRTLAHSRAGTLAPSPTPPDGGTPS
ncbi:NUDIX domain-containing protein [Streptomyces sp. NPDC004284]|uniref:NUDIX domain-containing protein n=1 Tax=Streptomyces sp. NPDC004284 TaxID=3364695 RepID=UPI003683AA6A